MKYCLEKNKFDNISINLIISKTLFRNILFRYVPVQDKYKERVADETGYPLDVEHF